MTTAVATPDPPAKTHPGPDPRELRRIEARYLIVNTHAQRDVTSERVEQIVSEFDWDKFEPITVTHDDRGYYVVVEGQHRTLAAQQIDPHLFVPCIVLRALDTAEQAETALGIVRGRKQHSAYDLWMLNYEAGHPHETAAQAVLAERGLRLGKSPSTTTISAIATIRTIVHGGHHSPEMGAERLATLFDVLLAAFPFYDHDSNITRWDRTLMLALNLVLAANVDVIDVPKLIKAVRAKPARQWVSIGRADLAPAAETIALHIRQTYNRGLKTRKIR